LPLPDLFDQRGQIMVRSGEQLRARLAHFVDNRVFHVSHFPINSSGVQIVGQRWLWAANAAARAATVSALLTRVEFQVKM
jgi:hypothetical protein